MTIDDPLELLARLARRPPQAGGVTLIEHALQCAHLALEEGARDELVVACLFHDVGRIVDDPIPTPDTRDGDDRHERVAEAMLRPYFPDRVVLPVRWHVAAKRYLCAIDAIYTGVLTTASRQRLELQGGPMSATEAYRFLSGPYAPEAIALRRWDDRAKTPGLATPALHDFEPIVRRCLR